MISATAKHRPKRSKKSDESRVEASLSTTRQAAALQTRARKIVDREIDFIANKEFSSRSAEKRILSAAASQTNSADVQKGSLPKDLPAHLARLCEAKLLTAEQERELFRRMNYLKFRANALRSRLNPQTADADMVAAVERLVEQASQVRDRIIKANMRLVISIVKKFVTPRHSFDELLSDGIVSLMHAVDKFDFDRGFRFSTYAYRAIARNAYRTITDQHKESSRFDAAISDDLTNVPEEERSSALGEHEWMRMRSHLAGMMDQLDRRERFIIRGRFALGSHRRVRTFQCLADKLGVSKERVRQLEQRAIAKLQAMAMAVDLEVVV